MPTRSRSSKARASVAPPGPKVLWPGRTISMLLPSLARLSCTFCEVAGSDGHHGDDRGNADHDAKQGQDRAQRIAPDRLEGELDRFPQHQAASRSVVGVDAPVDEPDGALRIGRHVRLMGDHDHRDALLRIEVGEQLHDLAAACGIEIAGRLVGQQHQRIGDDGAGDCHALLLAAGQFGRRMVLAACQAHAMQGLHGTFAPLAPSPCRGR